MVWDNVSWGTGTPVNESIPKIKENLNVLYNALGSNPNFATNITKSINDHMKSITAHAAASIASTVGPIVKSTNVQNAINELGSFQSFASTQIGTEQTDLGVEIKGRTLVNLLGTDGKCEDVTKWSGGTIDTSTCVFGSASIKQGYSWYTKKDLSLYCQDQKYYTLLVYCRTDSLTQRPRMTTAPAVGGQKEAYGQKIATWHQTYVKFQYNASASDKNVYLLLDAADASCNAWFDGARLYEIDYATYAKIDVDPEYTGDKLAAKFPYVDGVQFKNNTMITSRSKNLIPALDSGEWGLYPGIIVNSSYSMTLNTASTSYQVSTVDIPCKPSTQYTLSCTHNGKMCADVLDINKNIVQANTLGTNSKLTYTTTSNGYYLRVSFANNNNTTGTFTFVNPQLELGSAATTF